MLDVEDDFEMSLLSNSERDSPTQRKSRPRRKLCNCNCHERKRKPRAYADLVDDGKYTSTGSEDDVEFTFDDEDEDSSSESDSYTKEDAAVALSQPLPFFSKAFYTKQSMIDFFEPFLKRTSVLVALLLLQSVSGIILGNFTELLEQNVIITLFLTMLVGAGGNCGNQSTVLVIRKLAISSPSKSEVLILVISEAFTGLMEAITLSVVAVIRVLVFNSHATTMDILAITFSLFFIVVVSVVLGTLLPLSLWKMRFDPGHAGPVIQVLMDIIGVTVTCTISYFLLGS